MNRRHVLRAAAAASGVAAGLAGQAAAGRGGSGAAGPAAARLPAAEYALFKDRFVAPEGRVVDTGNGGVSHSEGQGYGMLFAAAADDRAGFARLRRWTEARLALRGDGLLAWRYDPAAPDAAKVPDRNNATDGDLLVAWALLRAAEAWDEPGARGAAAALARAVRARAVRETARGPMLLPGAHGFVHDGIPTVNPSYWVFPAFLDLPRVDPDPVWPRLVESGLALLRAARFGPHGLPPDWLLLAEPPVPSPRFPPVFGYNAVRVPLHLRWAGLGGPDLLGPFRAFWEGAARGPRGLAATADLATGALGPDLASPGIQAIAALVGRRPDAPPPAPPPVEGARDYYAAALILLTRLAASEGADT